MSNKVNTVRDTALVVGAAMRLTRLVVTDDLGQWWVKEPLDRMAHRSTFVMDDVDAQGMEWGHEDKSVTRWHRYLGGLDCPYCVGFWIGAGVMVTHAVAKASGPRALGVWRFVAGALTLNEVTPKLGSRVGDFG